MNTVETTDNHELAQIPFWRKLLNGIDVQWMPLREVCDLEHGFPIRNMPFRVNGNPFIRVKNIDDKEVDLSDAKFIDPDDFSGRLDAYVVRKGDVLITMSGANTGKIGFYDYDFSAYFDQRIGKFFANKDRLSNRYLFHCLLSNSDAISMLTERGTVPHLNSYELLEKISIPIPCPEISKTSLNIQAKIVKVLDNFTQLADELTAELTARGKQYRYYRDCLLDFKRESIDENGLTRIPFLQYVGENVAVKRIPLGDVAIIREGEPVNRRIIAGNPGKYPIINSRSEPTGFIGLWNTEDDPLGITTQGTRAGTITWQEGRYFRGNRNCSVTIKSSARTDIRYLYHLLMFMQSEIRALCEFDDTPALRTDDLQKLPIPVPWPDNPHKSLAIQTEIGSVLDKFDALANFSDKGLTYEIALRQKQYAYYRDMLLNSTRNHKVDS